MRLDYYKKIWNNKPSLRKVYEHYYKLIESSLIDGQILEIGSGVGNFSSNSYKVIKTDIQFSNSVNIVADAQLLPFSDNSFENIVLVDVLHHLECTIKFFEEASRVLKPKGKLIMIEPGITPISWLIFKLTHEEPVDMSWKPKVECIPDPNKDPYHSNQAIPTLLFGKYLEFFKANLNFDLIEKEWLSLFAYPLSGGFQKWSLISEKQAEKLIKFEKKIIGIFGPLMAFRIFVALLNKK